MSDSKTIDVYNRQVDDYVALTENQLLNTAIASFTALIPPAGRILDLGCGPGNTAAFLQEQGFSVDAVDASREMVRVAETKFGVKAICAEFSDIDSSNEYDGIWANFSLLHAESDEFPQILSALYRALKQKGVFHIGMKRGEGASRDHLGRFYCYYSQEQLETYLQNAGFSMLQVRLGEGRGLAGTVDQWIEVLCEADKV